MDKQNVLIIDDNTKNIQLAANVLKTTNLYNIYFATSGEKGIEQLKNRKYALILLDVNMPGLDGYKTAKIIKNDALQKDTPIIFLTAYPNESIKRKAMTIKPIAYLLKPIQDEILQKEIKKALG